MPPGLTPEQRLTATQGRLAADYLANLLIKKPGIAKGYGMGITIVMEEQPMKMMQEAPPGEEPGRRPTEAKSFFSRITARVNKLWTKK